MSQVRARQQNKKPAQAGRSSKLKKTLGGRMHLPMSEIGTLYKPIKKPITLRLDADVLAWFKTLGPGYQTRINSALRRLMLEQGKRGPQ